MTDSLIGQYYKTLFPLSSLLLLGTHNGRYQLAQLEVTFEIRVKNDEKIMIRNKHPEKNQPKSVKRPFVFESELELRQFILRKQPVSIHIGAIYWKPRRFQTDMKREKSDETIVNPSFLTFDVDANDYAIERMGLCSCRQYDMCKICCDRFVFPTVQAIRNLCKLMGFKKILTVFSGRRGFHVSVVDDSAYTLTREQRENINIRLKNDGFKLDEKVTIDPYHLKKLPMSIHSSTGNIARPVGKTFDFDTDIVHISNVTAEQIAEWTRTINNLFMRCVYWLYHRTT